MPDIVIVDESIFDQINRGNADVAKVLGNKFRENAELWITRDLEMRMKTEADKQLIRDLNVRAPMNEVVLDKATRSRLSDIPEDSVETAALAIKIQNQNTGKRVELLTYDKKLSDRFNARHGNVSPETRRMGQTTNATGRLNSTGRGYDYNQARRLLGLKPLNITGNGRVLSTKDAVATRGDPVKPVKEGPSERGQRNDAKIKGAKLFLQVVNYGMNKLNDYIQKKKYDAQWEKLEPGVLQQLDDDPTRGVLIMATYSTIPGDSESPIVPGPVFQSIIPTYGYTREDALANYKKAPQTRPAGPGQQSSEEIQWVPPKQAVDVKNVPTPFPPIALASFFTTREKILGVVWRGTGGFDETSNTEVSTRGVIAKFLVLEPPAKITWWNGSWNDTSIDTGLEEPYYVMDSAKKDKYGIPIKLPVVKMDSDYNFVSGGTSACMVYPADDATAAIFRQTNPVKDRNNQLQQYRMELLRFVEPENMTVMEYL